MSHQELQKVPGHTRLHRRGSKYYIRAKVPLDIQDTLKRKEYKHALKTSDYAEAVKRVKVESLKLDALFEKARQSVHHGAQTKTQLPSIDEGQAFNLIVQWFLKEEAKSEEWFDTQFRTLDQHEKKEVLASLQEEEAISRHTSQLSAHEKDSIPFFGWCSPHTRAGFQPCQKEDSQKSLFATRACKQRRKRAFEAD